MGTTGNNLKVPADLLKLLEAKAATEGKSVDDVAAETLRQTLKEKCWQDLLARGRERGRRPGTSEDRVPEIVREWRNEQRGR